MAIPTAHQPSAFISISPAATIGAVTLVIADLERSIKFYHEVLGFAILQQSSEMATLGAGTTPLLVLVERANARPHPVRTTGLYHFAILVPSRADLALSLAHLAEKRYPISGASDHLVSEAVYLDDPDGNGIEIYRDRPRSEWSIQNGQVTMGVDPLDIDGIMAELPVNREWNGLDPATRIGHIHLQVADLRVAEEFYSKLLGFDIVASMPSALFVSAGGYHHHIGMNTWNSRNASRPPTDAAGLRSFTIQIPDVAEQERLAERLQQVGVAWSRRGEDLVFDDPWGNEVILSYS